jgi:ABC-2 type transport system permease protein
MSFNKIWAVIRREYMERVRTKAFWIGTLLIPVFFLGYVAIQIASSSKAGGERKIVVVDLTGRLAQPLARDLEQQRKEVPQAAGEGKRESRQRRRDRNVHWVIEVRPVAESLEATKEALRREVLDKKIHGYLVLDPALLEKESAEYYSTTVSEFVALSQLERALNRIRLREKIQARGLPADLGSELEKRLDLKTLKVTEKGSTEEKGAGIITAIVFLIIMYSTFFMYGFQNLQSVIEEKTSRIVEIIISSVRPTELMLGKIIGIGLVGLTQYLVWCLIAMNLSAPAIAGFLSLDSGGMPRIPFSLIGYFILFFLLGYFLYASFYTAIGAPFNTNQEAQQLSMIPTLMIVSGMSVSPAVMNNPNGTVAVIASLFPFTAPLIMFLRTALAEPPLWQILLCVAILIASTVGIAWLAGRIYRVGILMYGKKPTIPEILRWVRNAPGKTLQAAQVVGDRS